MSDVTRADSWTLIDRMRRARESSGMSQTAIARHFRINPSTVSRWESGKTPPTYADVRLWAVLTEVPFDWLAGDDFTPSDQGERLTSR
ncbi:MAG: helix-turn-helix transcriptional regulator [Actinomycetota bacterium]